MTWNTGETGCLKRELKLPSFLPSSLSPSLPSFLLPCLMASYHARDLRWGTVKTKKEGRPLPPQALLGPIALGWSLRALLGAIALGWLLYSIIFIQIPRTPKAVME